MVETTETIGRVVRQNADFLATNTLESITNLILEKKALRKVYTEEHHRIHDELTRVSIPKLYHIGFHRLFGFIFFRPPVRRNRQPMTRYANFFLAGTLSLQLREDVFRIKAEYERCVESANDSRVKYEEALSKNESTAAKPRKLDDLKERFCKSSKRLHQVRHAYLYTHGCEWLSDNSTYGGYSRLSGDSGCEIVSAGDRSSSKIYRTEIIASIVTNYFRSNTYIVLTVALAAYHRD